jgi:hypothetical protein
MITFYLLSHRPSKPQQITQPRTPCPGGEQRGPWIVRRLRRFAALGGPGRSPISANLRGQKQDSVFFLPNDADALAPCRVVRRSNAEARQTAQVAQLPPVVRVSVVRSRKSEPEDRSE